MRLIIAGSRGATRAQTVAAIQASNAQTATLILSGDAKGADTFGAEWAVSVGKPVAHYPADWAKYGRSAGMKRNWEMAENADALLAIWDGQSVGTAHMIRIAREKGLRDSSTARIWSHPRLLPHRRMSCRRPHTPA